MAVALVGRDRLTAYSEVTFWLTFARPFELIEAAIAADFAASQKRPWTFARHSPILVLSWHSESRNGSSSLSSASGVDLVCQPA